jgi:flavin reductase (DIM6/NTAB) family NADH-FMN oxidoreductase RutF
VQEEVMTETVIDTREFRNALGNFATGVTIVTACGKDGRLAGVTASSFNSVSLDPPLVLWSLTKESPSLKIMEEASHFCVHVLSAEQSELGMKFAKAGDDKFAGVTYLEGLGGAPMFENCLANFQCRNVVHHEGGDHVIIVGEVEAFDVHQGEPLIFFRGKLGELCPV